MDRITYVAKSGKSYEVRFGPSSRIGPRSDFWYKIRTKDKSFEYKIGISDILHSTWRLDEASFNKLLLRFSFEKMKQWLDEGNEKDDKFCLITDNLKDYGLQEDKPPSLFFDYPKICSYRMETEEGLFCEAAAPYDTTQRATKWKICEYDCKVPEDFERCKWLIVQTFGSKAENDIRVGSRNLIGPDCEIRPDFDSLKDCEDCQTRQPCVIKSDVTGESLELAQKLLDLGLIKPAGNVARIILEDYLKALCDNNSLKYDSKETIHPLAQKLREAGVICDTEWGRIDWLARIGNNCSHPRKTVEREDVEKLIEEVGEFVGKPRPS